MKKMLSVLLAAAIASAYGSFVSGETKDSPCKDLKKTECEKKQGCCWVKGHSQKGKKVHGYCRRCGT
ncbi:MAG: hypothetical protein N2316_02355 [Spirochaetes bacterium]|nr:hypothetical protein [Spirochaetota bacterium]